MPFTVTVHRVDTRKVLNTVSCPDLASALRVKSEAFGSYHHSDLGGRVVVPATVDFDDWDDVDRLRHGNRGPFVPVHVLVIHSADRPSTLGTNETSPTTTSTIAQRGAMTVRNRHL